MEQEELFDSDFASSLLEQMGGSSASLVLDTKGICIFANTNSKHVLKIEPSELVGKIFSDSLNLLSLDGHVIDLQKHPVMKVLNVKDYVQTTPFFCRIGNTEDTYALTTMPIRKHDKLESVVVQIRKAQREVQVGEMKSLFVSFAAHQLKTPSSIVKGFLELMIRQGEAAYSRNQWNYLTSAFESNENLISVSKTLLNLARLEGGLIEPNIRSFEPSISLQNKIKSFSPIYTVKKLLITLRDQSAHVQNDVDLKVHLNSDESFFTEIFGILLGNAIKHSPNDSEITVTFNLTEDFCEVHVIDRGPGIAQAVQEKLFKAGQDSSPDENSHGLGLYMAKKYTALLGGEIGLVKDSEEYNASSSGTKGSNFYFKVPNVDYKKA